MQLVKQDKGGIALNKEKERFWIIFSIAMVILVIAALISAGFDITGITIHKGFHFRLN